ncbi:putative neutral sphingomyelinase [Agrilus planipennis]|uniref:sphingomyelin phosphodiesterase n=1 Tax=Agrilus planipennis TaxID=224129 RepID=A0A1W4X3U6_AGRPL|nr:putative neutral sphingomyelinase [Agrilus planipennis]XP_018327474.1 putative neutral sphingomyelinase [Agrilus planipennis]
MDLKVFTLNCWGIPIVSKDRKIRIPAIAEFLASGPYDFVCLQEVWSTADFELIRKKVEYTLPYSHYFYSGVVGSGVCVFSKFALCDVLFHQWPVNGYVHKIQHGDWFGGKGVGLCRIKVKNFSINIYSAHLHAEYDTTCDDYLAHRVLQAFDTAQFIKMTSTSADLIILAGDLNTEPESIAYRIIVERANLRDSFTEAKQLYLKTDGTNECCQNSYTSKALLKTKKPGKRIDYILFACHKRLEIVSVQYSQPLPNRIPENFVSYSDHEAVCASLKIVEGEKLHYIPYQRNDKEITLMESIKICDSSLNKLKLQKRFYWFSSMLLLCVVITTIATHPPFGLTITFHICRVILTILLCFTVAMASLWCRIEENAILAGKLAMEVGLKSLTSSDSL